MSEYVRKVSQAPSTIMPRLPHLDIELTERCNNDCIHCCINLPAGDRAAQAREMTTGQVQGLLTQAAELGCLEVRLTGGEPLLRSDFESIYLHARRLGLRVLIFTNARRITGRLADLWKRIPPLVPIEVTVYGMHRESYEAVTRSRGSHAQFRRGIDLLLDHQIPFVVKSALLPPNRQEIEEFEAWARTLPAMETDPGYSMFFDLRGRRDDEAKNGLIRSLRVPPEEGVAMLSRNEARYRKESEEFAEKFMGPSGDRLFVCGAGHSLCVDAYGRAQPCMGLRAPELTVDVLSSSLAEALERFASLKELLAVNPEYLRRCAVCRLKGFCEQCPAKSWAEHGTLDTPVEYLCQVAHAQARYLGWLDPGENAWKAKVSAGTAD
ncbi:MAG: radical SAM protein [Thermoleophilia bacterium]|nr:radical SAM protein [Thermoleophilia bacterium]